MLKVLLIDDDVHYISKFSKSFEKSFEVVHATAADLLNENLQIPLSSFGAILIDLFMPEIDGLGLWKFIKSKNTKLPPAFMLSENYQPQYREMAFKLGLMDYIHKEMSQNEILLRIINRVEITRQIDHSANQDLVEHGNGYFDFANMTCEINKQIISLTKTEYKVLREILISTAKSLSRDQLMLQVWPENNVVRQTLNTHIFNLNDKLSLWDHQISIDKNELVHLKNRGSQLAN